MDSPSNGSANYKLQAIKEALKNGSITKEQLFTRLSNAVEQEYQKPVSEQDVAFLSACQDILDEMRTGKVYVSRKEECKKALKQCLSQEVRHRSKKQNVLWRGALAAFALIVLAVGVEMLLHREWLEGASTDDGQQYVVQGQEMDPGIISDGIADNEPRTGELTTTNLDEAIKFLGFEPDLPTWMPEGWNVENYYVAAVSDSLKIITNYVTPDVQIVAFSQTRFLSIEDAFLSFEQNQEGTLFQIDKIEVYSAQNLERNRYTWKMNEDIFSLSGVINDLEATQMITSIIDHRSEKNEQ